MNNILSRSMYVGSNNLYCICITNPYCDFINSEWLIFWPSNGNNPIADKMLNEQQKLTYADTIGQYFNRFGLQLGINNFKSDSKFDIEAKTESDCSMHTFYVL